MELKTQDSRNGIYSENPIPYFHGILSREKESGLEGKTGEAFLKYYIHPMDLSHTFILIHVFNGTPTILENGI